MNATTRKAGHCHCDPGFTLIELMVVVAVIGILAAVAYPAYTQQIRKGHRADAKTAVLDMAAREEKFFAINNAYTDVGDATGLNYGISGALSVPVTSNGGTYYNLTVSASSTDYTIKATPTGSQTSDPCYTYQLTSNGVQSNLVSGGGANTTTGCW